jgi:hypothetical protein
MFDNEEQEKNFNELLKYLDNDKTDIATAFLVDNKNYNNFMWRIKDEPIESYYDRFISNVEELDIDCAFSYIPRCSIDKNDYVVYIEKNPMPDVMKIWERDRDSNNKEWKISEKGDISE